MRWIPGLKGISRNNRPTSRRMNQHVQTVLVTGEMSLLFWKNSPQMPGGGQTRFAPTFFFKKKKKKKTRVEQLTSRIMQILKQWPDSPVLRFLQTKFLRKKLPQWCMTSVQGSSWILCGVSCVCISIPRTQVEVIECVQYFRLTRDSGWLTALCMFSLRHRLNTLR